LFFEGGQGNIVDENGNDSMEIVEEGAPRQLEDVSSHTTYLQERAKIEQAEHEKATVEEAEKLRKPVRRQPHNVRVRDEIKAEAAHLVDIHPKNSARAVALELNLQPMSVQRWYKAWQEDSDSLFKPLGRPPIIEPEGELAKDTKKFVIEYFYEKSTATVDQLMEAMTDKFRGLTISKATVYRYMQDY
ncbi:hypothetical protein BDF20DRAFT_821696, partial [Mycotypha africana]|uniref:uncharacterized protein n=1 Tax=Mycotypha africana TaxID=64632 RepID=UPI002300C57D